MTKRLASIAAVAALALGLGAAPASADPGDACVTWLTTWPVEQSGGNAKPGAPPVVETGASGTAVTASGNFAPC